MCGCNKKTRARILNLRNLRRQSILNQVSTVFNNVPKINPPMPKIEVYKPQINSFRLLNSKLRSSASMKSR